jgi:hypothetical protein
MTLNKVAVKARGISYVCGMNTNRFTRVMRAERAIEAARLRRHRMAELGNFFSGATMVLTGLLMAVAYCLFSHQIQI